MAQQAATGSRVVRALRGGQITLPAEFRRALEIEEGTLLAVSITGEGEMCVRPVEVIAANSEGSPWLKELYELFAPVRQEAIDKGYTDEEMDRWIDEAVAEVRRERRLKSGQSGQAGQRDSELQRAG